ncbi:hypothetical protein N7478_008943 [Penicillium angulare]|uniref:uncharacterized protein n=1 Tax=Penicillium angulare TaxID=116970 RepID=UPI0025426377|nr:uncharacterized protein N7478_008943 [Penicillium angulare]KAJ5273818.1 hypothetical protein N7478_008943 [Penicillium angulare]
MPVRRAKACLQCRKAKSRCSLSTPCSRCTTRRLDCQYVRALPHLENRSRAAFRPIRPATNSFTPNSAFTEDYLAGTLAGISPRADHDSSAAVAKEAEPDSRRYYTNIDENELFGSIQGGTEYGIPELPPYSDFTSYIFDMPESSDTPLAMTPATSHNSQMPEDTSADPSSFDMISPLLLNLEFPFDNPAFPTPHPTESTPSTKIPGPQLAQRPRSLQQGSLTARMVLSRMKEYSRMMADAKTLPPFIFPPCCLGPDDECPQNTSHRCLPEALAVCSNLTQMFYNRMPGSHNFVWKQICAHIRQMREEVRFYCSVSLCCVLFDANELASMKHAMKIRSLPPSNLLSYTGCCVPSARNQCQLKIRLG